MSSLFSQRIYTWALLLLFLSIYFCAIGGGATVFKGVATRSYCAAGLLAPSFTHFLRYACLLIFFFTCRGISSEFDHHTSPLQHSISSWSIFFTGGFSMPSLQVGQRYFVLIHTAYILYLFSLYVWVFVVFHYGPHLSATFIANPVRRLGCYIMPGMVASLFFGGIWSMHNDFLALFWSWDYIEIFFLDCILGYVLLAHTNYLSRTILLCSIFLPIIILRIFRFSILESVHHLSTGSSSTRLGYNFCWLLHLPLVTNAELYAVNGSSFWLLVVGGCAVIIYNHRPQITSSIAALCGNRKASSKAIHYARNFSGGYLGAPVFLLTILPAVIYYCALLLGLCANIGLIELPVIFLAAAARSYLAPFYLALVICATIFLLVYRYISLWQRPNNLFFAVFTVTTIIVIMLHSETTTASIFRRIYCVPPYIIAIIFNLIIWGTYYTCGNRRSLLLRKHLFATAPTGSRPSKIYIVSQGMAPSVYSHFRHLVYASFCIILPLVFIRLQLNAGIVGGVYGWSLIDYGVSIILCDNLSLITNTFNGAGVLGTSWLFTSFANIIPDSISQLFPFLPTNSCSGIAVPPSYNFLSGALVSGGTIGGISTPFYFSSLGTLFILRWYSSKFNYRHTTALMSRYTTSSFIPKFFL